MDNDEKTQLKTGRREPVAGIVERNIKALVDRRIKEEREKPIEERIADRITRFTGNMAFVYSHVLIYGLWVIWNVGWIGLKPFDASFVGLGLETQIEAIFLATFVLMSQNSLDSQADKRADLDLQMGLLSEHEITRVLGLVSAIADKLGVAEAHSDEISELAKDIEPERVMDTMESHKQSVLQAQQNAGQ